MTQARLACKGSPWSELTYCAPLQAGTRVSCMTVRGTGAGASYMLGSDEGRKLRLGEVRFSPKP